MAFDPKKYMAPAQRLLPVILMLDVSGSMQHEQKIDRLYSAVQEMIDTFVDLELKETLVQVAIVTFGEQVRLHTPYTPVTELKKNRIPKLVASGQTPLATALEMVRDMIEDRDVTPHNTFYAPQVVLVSDGHPYPANNWQDRLDEFIGSRRSGLSQRFSLSIGTDADIDMLRKFAGTDENVFYAEKASDIADAFKQITISISKRSKPSIPQAPVQPQVQPIAPQTPKENACANGYVYVEEEDY